jgi:hypothetical protein
MEFKPMECSIAINVNDSTVADINSEISRLQKRFQGLHAVQRIMQNAPNLDYFKCDCKRYLTYGVLCEHIMIALHHCNYYNLSNLLEAIEQPKKCGRKRKHSPALSKA